MQQRSHLHPALRRLAFGAALILLGSDIPAAWAQGQIFVTNYNGNTVTTFARKATGDVAPLATIFEGLSGPHQIAINHAAGELVVANNLAFSLTVYDMASGALKRTVSGDLTGLNRPTGVAVDAVNGEIYVANDYGNTITVYDLLADGNASPKRTIESVHISGPAGLAVDLVHDELVVATQGFHSVATFDRTATGITFPKRIIGGFFSALNLPQGIALDLVNDEILVANSSFLSQSGGSILAFARTATGDTAPLRKLEGDATQLCHPFSVALDRSTDEIVVANFNFGGSCVDSIATYSRTADGNTAPHRTIAGTLAGFYSPASAAITSASTLTVKNQALKSSVSAGATVGYAITAIANGGPVFNVSLSDTLPSGLSWSLDGANAANCTISELNALTCMFGDLAKGEARQIQVSALTTSASCPGFTNQATASFNDGTADVTTASKVATINIKCR